MNKQLSLWTDCPDPMEQKGARWVLHVDGAARKNPGPAGAGAYLTKDGADIFKKGFYLGSRTNNQAEYLALLVGVWYFVDHAESNDFLEVISDSELLIRQMIGRYRVRHPELLPLYTKVKHALQPYDHCFRHVLREFNTVADELANIGIDSKLKAPQAFWDFVGIQ